MTIEPAGGAGGGGAGTMARPNSSSLADVIDTILDKGLVIDAFARVSLVGIELVTIDARVVVASVDTYLRFAEAVNRLEISTSEPKGITDIVGDVTQGAAKHKTSGALEAAGEKVMNFLGDVEDKRQTASRPRRKEDR
ncbi:MULTISPECIES: gas vesicle protein GvpJ [Nocardia]|uniref:Gas vesicle protein A n=1 Tax=Nocardia abscessus TaxID=120957 RepID=A0ABS0CD08_9NOCA|nr:MULTISPECIES: gas vesicle protein GvpJ [Nocardia]MBF6228232.1 gas vesicle structural protein GvpA [Nocardia abscessus]MCC3329339.1 gas vesicle structural protein GvpA [Nocardia abscessus]UGT65683.1 gas vesicle structural protein GvpA [Nocardia gipuzkoensis]